MKHLKNYPYYEHMPVDTLQELLDFCTIEYGDRTAFRYLQQKEDCSVSFSQFRNTVENACFLLRHRGFLNKRIGILGENSYGWILSYFAIACSGNITVPLDKELSVEELTFLLQDSHCSAIFYSDGYTDVAEVLKQAVPKISYYPFSVLLTASGKLLSEVLPSVTGDSLASIVYTSGTTGIPKGVLLTHKNLCSSTCAACQNVFWNGPSVLLLPLHHTFGLVAGVLCDLYYGYAICINRSLKRLSDDFARYHPQHLFCVPMIVESLYKNIWIAARKNNKEATLRKLIKFSNFLLDHGIDLRRKLFRQVLDGFGGNLELIVSGGAPLDNEYVQNFRSFGITVLNGYGITECGPVVAVNRNYFNVPDSVGIPLSCNKVRVSEEGEIQVRGDNVTSGYYHNASENEKAFTEDGWFRTGDLGFFDEYGALHINGRIKNLIILSNGENIPAESLEHEISSISYVKEVIAFGKNDRICIEVYIDEESGKSASDLEADVQILNKQLPLNRNISEVIVRDNPFPKTTTKKIKRDYGGLNYA